jgi:hypothetical protein
MSVLTADILPPMPFNVHPIFLIWLIYLLLLVGAAYVIAWAAGKGSEAAEASPWGAFIRLPRYRGCA